MIYTHKHSVHMLHLPHHHSSFPHHVLCQTSGLGIPMKIQGVGNVPGLVVAGCCGGDG